MKNRIKFISNLFLVFTLLFSTMIIGCGNNATSSKKKIVCTTYPIYDWVNNIIKGQEDTYDVILLMDKNVDLHNFQPTAEDIININSSDLFIYIGGESDEWVEDTLKDGQNTLNLMETLGDNLNEEILKEGMEDDGEDEEELAYDEHIWLSLKNANILTSTIEKSICDIDDKNKTIYDENLASYQNELKTLDNEYKKTFDKLNNKVLIFGDRFPFSYLLSDYGLDYYAAFKGCSAETEASFETITFLANKVDEINSHYIFALESSDGKIAQTIKESTKTKDQEIIKLNSLQSKTNDSYIDVMKSNLEQFKGVVSND